MPTSSTCLHRSFCKMLPSILGYVPLSFSSPCPLSLQSIPHSSLIISRFPPPLSLPGSIMKWLTIIPHHLINLSPSHTRCLTLWLDNSILTVINLKNEQKKKEKRERMERERERERERDRGIEGRREKKRSKYTYTCIQHKCLCTCRRKSE